MSFSENIRYLAPEQLDFVDDWSSCRTDVYYELSSNESDMYYELSSEEGDVYHELSSEEGDVYHELSSEEGDVYYELSPEESDVYDDLSSEGSDVYYELSLEESDVYNGLSSKESDVYSLAMTSFTVCSPRPPPLTGLTLDTTISSSRECCRMIMSSITMTLCPIFGPANGPLAQRIRMGIDGCRMMPGI